MEITSGLHSKVRIGGREKEGGETAVPQAWGSALLGSSVGAYGFWDHYLKYKNGNLKGKKLEERVSDGQLLKSTKISETEKSWWLAMCFLR